MLHWVCQHQNLHQCYSVDSKVERIDHSTQVTPHGCLAPQHDPLPKRQSAATKIDRGKWITTNQVHQHLSIQRLKPNEDQTPQNSTLELNFLLFYLVPGMQIFTSSHCIAVVNRWAIKIEVRSLANDRSAVKISPSVELSSALVASSQSLPYTTV